MTEDSFEENPTSLMEKTQARESPPHPVVVPVPKVRHDLAPKLSMQMEAPVRQVTRSEIEKVRNDYNTKKLIIQSSRLSELPDRGAKLTAQARALKQELQEMEEAYKLMPPEAVKPAYGTRNLLTTYTETELRSVIQKKKVGLLFVFNFHLNMCNYS